MTFFTRSVRVGLVLAAAILCIAAPARALDVSGGDIPLPVKAGTTNVTWDGEYSDLLAADALAMCWTTQQDRGTPLTPYADDEDLDIRNLLGLMGVAGCKTTCSNPAMTSAEDIAICAWLEGRQNPTCNIDAASSQPRALDVSALRSPQVTQPYTIPSPAALGLSGTAASQARGLAQDEVSYADLNLCMAEQLQDKLDTVQIAFATNDDLARLQERVRQRAVLAVDEYTLIAKALATTMPAPTVINNQEYFLAVFSAWRKSLSQSTAAALGNDFAQAIRLLADATEATVSIKMRDPAAQDSFGKPAYGTPGPTFYTNGTPYYGQQTGYFYGMSGPRAAVLANVLYEGMYTSPASSLLNPVLDQFAIRSMTTDMSAPEVGVLLGLARQANALSIRILKSGVTRLATANTLLANVETYLRQQDCQAQNIPLQNCVGGTVGMPPTQTLVWQRYGITIEHAKVLADALAELVFGPPSPTSRGADGPAWSYVTQAPQFYTGNPADTLFVDGEWGNNGPAERLSLHLLGQQSFTGNVNANPTGGFVKLDPNFSVAAPRAHDIQSMRAPDAQLPVRDVNPSGDFPDQFPYYRVYQQWVTIGSNTALALAREAILQVASSPAAPQALSTALTPVVSLIETEIGSRQVLLRPQMQSTPNPSACLGCVTLVPASTTSGTTTTYSDTIDVVTKSDDPFTFAAAGPNIPLAATLAIDPNTTTVFGTNHTSISSLPYSTLQQTTLSSGYVLRTGPFTWTDSTLSPPPILPRKGVTVLLRSGTEPTASYQHIFTGRLLIGATAVTFGGNFGRLVDAAFEFDPSNWSMPRYDGFGLPRHWTPAADASLLGDPAGETIEQHFIDRATTAASDATAALQQAFMTLQQQETDEATLAAADAKAQQLTALEVQSLCGAKTACAASYTWTLPSVPKCSGTLASNTDCQAFQNQIATIVGDSSTQPGAGVALASDVASALASSAVSPTFDAYNGGSLQGLLLAEWNAWNAVNGALTSALATAGAAIAQVTAADADLNAANQENAQVEAQVNAGYAQLAAQNSVWAAQQQQYQANASGYDAQTMAAEQTVTLECDDHAFNAARLAGFSYQGGDDLSVSGSGNPNGWNYTINNIKNKTWSSGPTQAQVDKCQAAKIAAQAQTDSAKPQKDALQALIAALQAQMDASGLQHTALGLQAAASQAKVEAAIAKQAEARQGRESQMASASQLVQAAYGQLLAAVAAIDEAFNQANVANGKISVDQQQTGYDVRTRFGVRTRFQSYDMWRARALVENARRLAVAARRTIEERYVVDLSTMHSPEPFVDAPALWADDVYSYDLKPPFSVGLTHSPMQGSGAYTGALEDYVSNLKLFLDGFAVQRPSAAVASDAEVIQLPAPAAQVVGTAYQATVSYIDPASSGWAFYCPASDTWIANPDVGTFSSTGASWTLSTACGGQPPTLARLGFWLDPWGRLRGSTGDPPPFVSRYNTRVGNLVLNLVGSGIRNCQMASDPSTCYAEPFIQYDMKQVGPAWVTDYDQRWQSLDIPIAVIEGGKALAIEEWLDPVSNGFNRPDVLAAERTELKERPIGGAYELTLYLTPDVQVEQIQRIQLLVETSYWVKQ
jgi:hypothetical protein